MLINTVGLSNHCRSAPAARWRRELPKTTIMNERLKRICNVSNLATTVLACLLAGCQSHKADQQTSHSSEEQSQQVSPARKVAGQQPQQPLTAVGPQKGDAAKAAGRVSVATPQGQSSLTIGCDPPVYLFIVDPQGRKKGFDTADHRMHDDIPDAAIDEAEGGDGGQSVFIPRPIAGHYRVASSAGEAGTYGCTFNGVDTRDQSTPVKALEHIPINKDEIQKFDVTFDGSPGSHLNVAGGFAPSAMLSYASPTTTSVVLPAGQREAAFLIFYDEHVDVASFSATLNGALLTRLFHPQVGAWELIKIPLTEHRNRVQLAISSQDGTAVKDTFEIAVP